MKKDTWLQIRVSKDKKEEIKEHACKKDETISEFVVKSVDDRIEGMKDEEKR